MAGALNAILRSVARKAYNYLKDDPAHRREFEEWYEAKYGKKYEWRKDYDE